MSGKPFDIAAAKRGERVQYDYGFSLGGWRDVHFIGVGIDGAVVVQHITGSMGIFDLTIDPLGVTDPHLRMAPKPPKEMWVQLYANSEGEVFPSPLHDTPEQARGFMKGWTLTYPLRGGPQKVLVPDES